MKTNRKVINQYLKDVGENTVCKKHQKKFYLNEIKNVLISYAENKPELTYEDLEKEFGSPKDFADRLSEKEEFPRLLKKANIKAVLWAVFLIFCIAVLVFVIVLLYTMIEVYFGTYDTTDAIPSVMKGELLL